MKNEIISKELLSAVLVLDENGYYPSKVAKVFIRNNEIIENWTREDNEVKINIYGLAHKCKEWAFDLDYDFNIVQQMYNLEEAVIYMVVFKRGKISKKIELGRTQLKNSKAFLNTVWTFKACQWIYDNINVKMTLIIPKSLKNCYCECTAENYQNLKYNSNIKITNPYSDYSGGFYIDEYLQLWGDIHKTIESSKNAKRVEFNTQLQNWVYENTKDKNDK